MNHHYDDIRAAAGEPQWWDENAVPRYCDFAPDQVANIYANEAAFAEITCQGCGHLFKVAFSRSSMDRSGLRISDAIGQKKLHYGDPPNIGCCASGPTMNSEPRRVLEYWWRPMIGFDFSWKRVESLEIDIKPDWVGE